MPAGFLRRGPSAALVVALLTLGALAGCSSPAPVHRVLRGDGIVAASGTEPGHPLLPTDTDDAGGRRVVAELFEPLVLLDAAGQPHDAVAASITSADDQHWSITLRRGLVFSDGTPVTAHSFVDAWTWGATSTNRQRRASAFAGIAGYAALAASPPTARTLSGLHVVDEDRFTVDLAAPDPAFRLQLGDLALSPLPPAAFTDPAAFGQAPVGNGPYALAGPGAWVHGRGLDLVPDRRYRGSRRPANGGIAVSFSDSAEAAYDQLLDGGLDVVDAVPPVATATLARDLGRRALRARSAALVSITIPAGLPHFAGEEGRLRRQAVSAAVDRDRIVREALGSTAEPARDVTAPSLPGWTGSTPGAQVLTHDAARARRLWAQADRISPWSGPFTISYAADSGQQEEVDAITRDVAATLRVDARGTPYPSQAALEADVGERIVGGAWLSTQRAPYPSRLGMLSAWCTSGASGNDGNYRDGEVDALVARAASAPTAAAAAALVDRAQTVLLRDLPVIPLWYPGAVGGRSAMVSGVRFGWDGLLRYDEIAKR